MIILGIDPGLAIVGWGVIESVKGVVRPIAYGAITTPAHTDVEARLLMIQNDIEALINKYRPDEMAIEELFFNTNITTLAFDVMDSTNPWKEADLVMTDDAEFIAQAFVDADLPVPTINTETHKLWIDESLATYDGSIYRFIINE